MSMSFEAGAERFVKHEEVDQDETNDVEINLSHAVNVSTDKVLSSDHIDYCDKSFGKSTGRQKNSKKQIKSGSICKVPSKNTKIWKTTKGRSKTEQDGHSWAVAKRGWSNGGGQCRADKYE